MIDVYTWTTGNSRKIPIFLEEAEVPYRLHMIDIRNGEQFKPEFVAICPNSKVPAIVDQDGPGGKPLSLFESGAILIYLADKYRKFIGNDAADTVQHLGRMNADGSNFTVLATMSANASGSVAVDDECIYWSNASGIFSVAKAATGPFTQ